MSANSHQPSDTMTTVRITPPLFKQRYALLVELGKAIDDVANCLGKIRCKLTEKEYREYKYLLHLHQRLYKGFKELYIQATHRVNRTKKIQNIEKDMFSLMKSIETVFYTYS